MKEKKYSKQDQNKPSFIVETLKIYQSVKTELEELRKFKAMKGKPICLEDVTKSAYSKCYDFIIHMCSSSNFEDYFFYLPMLRSICEDFISITYIKQRYSETEANKLINELHEFSLCESIIVQEDFFQKYNPFQIVPSSDLLQTSIKNRINNKPTNKNQARQRGYPVLPSVFKMADEIGYIELYKFIYFSTSKYVHFTPDTLMKLGWGQGDEKSGILEGKFSYKNNFPQYVKFSIFYSSYLFIYQTKEFANIISISDKIKDITEDLLNKYEKIDWTEITTFEELNLDRPNLLLRSVYRFSKTDESNKKS